MILQNNMVIRRATENDRDTVRDMILKSDKYHYKTCKTYAKKVDRNPKKYYQQSYTLIDRIDINDFYIMELHNKPIGTIMEWDNKGETTLINFYIDEKYRGRGYGKILLNHVIKNMKTSYCVLSVYGENKKSLEFYYKFGFYFIQYEESDSGRLLWLRYDK